MLINYFKSTKPINFILLSVLFVFFILSYFFLEENPFISMHQVLKLLGLLTSFYLFVLVTKDKLRSSKDDFGILMYVLLTAIFITVVVDLDKIGANILVTLSLHQLYGLKNKDVFVKENVFNIGILLGVATILYPLSAMFLLYTYMTIVLFSTLSWRIILILMIGFAIPFLIVYLINDLFLLEIAVYTTPFFSLETLFLGSYWIIGVFLILLLFWALFYVFSQLNIKLLYYKNYFFLVLVHLIVAITMLFLSPNKNGSEYIFLLYPLSSLLANFFVTLRKWSGNIVLLLLIISAFSVALNIF